MKKVIGVAIVCLLVLGMLVGCESSRTAITADTFVEKTAAADYQTGDVTSQFASQADLVKSVTLALKDAYQIEVFVFTDEGVATTSYNTNKATAEAAKVSSSTSKSVSMGNYSYYYLTTGDQYYVVSRIDNTMIFAHCGTEYKAELEKMVSELGY